MTTTSGSTRRAFIQTTIQTAGAGLSVPLAAAAANAPAIAEGDGDPLKARLACLEDLEAIRALNQEYARRVNAGAPGEPREPREPGQPGRPGEDDATPAIGALFANPSDAPVDPDVRGVAPDGFGERDVIDLAPDRQTATALLHCTVQMESTIGPDCPLVDMARQQGGGVVRRTERGVFENAYIRRDGVWKILRTAFRALVLVMIAVTCTPTPGFGQWLHYPTADVPRKADGSPDLTAPAPRLPDGKTDFSGIWHVAERNPCTRRGASQFIECGTEIGGSPLALDLGRNMPGGLPYQPWAAALVTQRTADNSRDDPHVRCLPDNPPRPWGLPHLTKAVHTPKLLVLLYEVNAMYRQIFIDGRPLPSDPTPGWNGYSTARWDGDTLVVQTAGFRDNLWIDMGGSPMSDAARMTERMRRPNYGTLELDITVDDPKVYTRPWTVSMNRVIVLDTELIDEFCLENEKSYQRMQPGPSAK